MAFFKGADFVGLTQTQTNVVKSVQQAIFAEGIDFKRIAYAAVGGTDHLLGQINHQFKTGECFYGVD